MGSNCPYFFVVAVTFAIAVDLNRMEEVFELDSASGDWAGFRRPCIAWPVLHHCCLVDLDMVVVPLEPTNKNRKHLVFY